MAGHWQAMPCGAERIILRRQSHAAWFGYETRNENNFLTLFRVAHVTHIQHGNSYEIYPRKEISGRKTVGTDRHPVADWTLGYSRKPGLSENPVVARYPHAALAIGTSRDIQAFRVNKITNRHIGPKKHAYQILWYHTCIIGVHTCIRITGSTSTSDRVTVRLCHTI